MSNILRKIESGILHAPFKIILHLTLNKTSFLIGMLDHALLHNAHSLLFVNARKIIRTNGISNG